MRPTRTVLSAVVFAAACATFVLGEDRASAQPKQEVKQGEKKADKQAEKATAKAEKAADKADKATAKAEAATRAPIAPQGPVSVKTSQDFAELDRTLRSGNKTTDIVAGLPLPYTVQVMREEKFVQPAAEIHDGKDHVFLVVEGSTTFQLGGKLVDAKEIGPGEWRGPRIEGGKTFEAPKGSMITIPRGNPHFRTTKDSVTLVSVSIYSKNVAEAPRAK